MLNGIKQRIILSALLVALIIIGGCDNPIKREESAICEHVDAEGLVVRDGIETIVTQWLGTTEGRIEIGPGKVSPEYSISFLTPDSVATVPGEACVDHALRWIIEDTSIVSIQSATDKWSVNLTGKRSGTTNIRFQAWHGDHADFTSLPIQVVVGDLECDPIAVVGINAVVNDSIIASVNPAANDDTITIDEGANLVPVDIEFTDSDASVLTIPDNCANFELVWQIYHPDILEVEKVIGQDYQLRLTGLEPGETSLSLTLLHSDTIIYTSPAITIIVNEVCGNLAADGYTIKIGDSLVASQWIGNVSGSLEVTEGLESDTMTISFLDFDSTFLEILTGCDHQRLGWIIGDNMLADVKTIDGIPWRFVIEGKSAGITFIRFQAIDGDHAAYTTLPLPLVVNQTATHTPIGATSAALEYNCTMIASWNYDSKNGANESIGYLVVEAGHSIQNVTALWFDTLANEYGELIPLDPSESGYSLGYSIANTDIATALPTSGERWGIDISGVSSGVTTITLQLLYDGLPELATGPLNIMVRPEITPESDSGSFMITKGGVWYVVARDGVLLSDICDLIGPSQFSVGAGELSDLYSFWLPDPPGSCGRDDFSTSRYNLAFEFTDPCIAKVVNHPIHWGEKRIFHLQGLVQGTTGLKIHFIDRLTNEVDFTSPAIPVTVEP